MTRPHEEKINHLTFQMLPVQGGSFRMGSTKDDKAAFDWEKPDHDVTVRDFYLGQYPVTQDLWLEIMKENPSFFPGDRRPVERVSWDDAQIFIEKLNGLTKKSRPEGQVYRLPTEAEWEYAARGGIRTFPITRGKHGDDSSLLGAGAYAGGDKLKEVGWYSDNSYGETKPVGLKAPNALGLYDMSGNVWELCADYWHDNYNQAPKDGSAWINIPERGSRRVLRGGSWIFTAQNCRSAYRRNWLPVNRFDYIGFRLALAPQ